MAAAAAAAIMMSACEPDKVPDDAKTAKIELSGKKFELELALDNQTRFHGLSDRTEIKAEGGMLFVFSDQQVQVMQFVMRDCPVAIDIIFLDRTGRITAMHKMPAEAPRAEDEKENKLPFPGAPAWAGTNEKYENRLKKYSSKFPAQFAIELKGNTLDELKLKEGQKIEFDRASLVKRAK